MLQKHTVTCHNYNLFTGLKTPSASGYTVLPCIRRIIKVNNMCHSNILWVVADKYQDTPPKLDARQAFGCCRNYFSKD